MVSCCSEGGTKPYYFYDDGHQITIGIPAYLWPKLQSLANEKAKINGYLGNRGTDWDYLNILIVGRVFNCPKEKEPWQWVAEMAI